MDTPLISIIIPVYKAEKYLQKTVDSVLSQTYANWELILVDDGSPDSCGQICDDYSQKDIRILSFHQNNSGVSAARNRGLNECHGDFCCFVDSDDWLESSYLNNFLVPDYHQYGCILQSYCVDNEITGTYEQHILPQKVIKSAAELEYFLEYTDGVHNGFLWHRLFCVQTIRNHNILFPEGVSFAEDGVFFLHYIQHSENFLILSNIGYHYIVRKGSLTDRGKTLEKQICYRLIEGIVAPTSAIISKCKPKQDIINGLKKYNWRLIISWLFERGMKGKNDYYEHIAFIKDLQNKYYLDDKDLQIPILRECVIKIVCSAPTDVKYYGIKSLLKISAFLKKVEYKIVYLFKRN